MLELYHNEMISEEQCCHINFSLAKACEDLEDFEQAMSHYNEEISYVKTLNYDISEDLELFQQIIFNYPKIKQTH